MNATIPNLEEMVHNTIYHREIPPFLHNHASKLIVYRALMRLFGGYTNRDVHVRSIQNQWENLLALQISFNRFNIWKNNIKATLSTRTNSDIVLEILNNTISSISNIIWNTLIEKQLTTYSISRFAFLKFIFYWMMWIWTFGPIP